MIVGVLYIVVHNSSRTCCREKEKKDVRNRASIRGTLV